MSENLAVLGAGSWAIAIGNLLTANGHKVSMWEFNRNDYEILVSKRMHPQKLPGIEINPGIVITNDISEAVNQVRTIIMAVPAQKVRNVCSQLDSLVPSDTDMVNLAKGIEIGSLSRMSEVIKESLSRSDNTHIATLSGPSHAEEVSRNLPTSAVAASSNETLASRIQELFSNNTFRVYRSADLIGVELGGSLKNVIAIAAGIIHGLGFGDNTMGALITRGLAEISRTGIKMGADPLTFAGLSGIGDLITTCISPHSRNHQVGERIGKGERLKDILSSMVMVAEGVDTCRSAYELSNRYDVEMPITVEVHKVLFEDKDPRKAVTDLMGRSLKEEVWS